jgi:hypothetical protein
LINYAVIDEDNLVTGYSQFGSEVDSPILKKITSEQFGALSGYRWVRTESTGNVFEEVPNPILNLVLTTLRDAQGPLDITDRSVALKTGATTHFTVQIQNDQGVIAPVTQDFVLPIAGIYGTEAFPVTINFINGVAEFSILWDRRGMYEVTETQVNHNTQGVKKFNFERFEFRIEGRAS